MLIAARGSHLAALCRAMRFIGWDNQFYPDGVPGAEVMANASPNVGLELAKNYW
jgi:N-acetyl-beta-hexosaminidase